MKRARQHECSNAIENDIQSCGNEGFWLEWSEWSGCSASCVGGTQYRRRGHSCSTEVDMESRSCGDPGYWAEWTEWSGCSTSCYGGSKYRNRYHSCGAAAILADIITAKMETEEATFF